MNRSTPGLPVHHQLLEFTQTHVHRVGDAVQPSHPLSSPSPPAPNPSQHQGLPQRVNSAWGGQSVGVSASASFLPMNTQDWSFKYVFVVPSRISLSRMNYIPLDVCSEKAMAPPLQYSCLENPMDRGAWWAAVHGVSWVGHEWATSLSLFTFLHWRRKWQPTPVFLSGEPQRWRSLVGFLPMGLHRVGYDWSDLAAAADVCWQYVTTICHFRTWPTSKWVLTY